MTLRKSRLNFRSPLSRSVSEGWLPSRPGRTMGPARTLARRCRGRSVGAVLDTTSELAETHGEHTLVVPRRPEVVVERFDRV